MANIGTVQQSISAIPVKNINPPSEGTMAAQIDITLTPQEPSFATVMQLNSASGLMVSQVITLVINNYENAYPINVIHGVLNEITQVAAGATVICPTFSNNTTFPLNVSVLNSVTPTMNLDVNIIFLNYSRAPGSFSSAAQSSILGNVQNSSPIITAVPSVITGGLVILAGPANFILDSLNFCVENIKPIAAGVCDMNWALQVVVGGTPVLNIATGILVTFALNADQISGAVICFPENRTWPSGLILPRAGSIALLSSGLTNMTNVNFRFNASGFQTP
jgi:hypothetical protein